MSVKATPVRPVLAVGLVMVNVRVEVLFNGIEVGLNPFWIDGGATTVRLAVFGSRSCAPISGTSPRSSYSCNSRPLRPSPSRSSGSWRWRSLSRRKTRC